MPPFFCSVAPLESAQKDCLQIEVDREHIGANEHGNGSRTVGNQKTKGSPSARAEHAPRLTQTYERGIHIVEEKEDSRRKSFTYSYIT